MSKLVLISHGSFSAALKSSAEMIMGPQPEIATVSLEPSEGPEDFRKKFEAAIAGSTDVTVLADLKGGTPSNVAAAVLAETGNFDLYAGANLPMVISYLNAEMLGMKPELIKDGQAGVVYINDLVNKPAHH
ncbi:PTS sugar transporter subunit IIA [Lacticaseibacillus jixianensis]|uniref:PTS sugar transporter subunit IIA n=1 Tax=Lacticaseibacillus jixianensis TaxID=2486012 RepID=A0ABW4BBI2_9LACO|nr:PTS sugar transporter subunit IIA [Lacticaseibacillus jixianensis]